jgi:hypothetical protein
MIIIHVSGPYLPIAVAVRSKAVYVVLGHLNTGVWGSNFSRTMDVCPCYAVLACDGPIPRPRVLSDMYKDCFTSYSQSEGLNPLKLTPKRNKKMWSHFCA